MDTLSSKTSKVARYNWTVKDKTGTFWYIDKTDLCLDHENYQRDGISKSKVIDMASDWSWIACGALSVARRPDGSLWVMDGQYRLTAALQRADITTMPCMVFDVEDIRKEAEGFISVNTNRKPMLSIHRFKAQATAGDEDAIFVKNLIEASNRKMGNVTGGVRCVAAMISWSRRDRVALHRMWPILDEMTVKDTLPSQLLEGMMYLETSMLPGHSLCDAKNRERILRIGASEFLLAARASAHFRGKGGAKIWADGICQRFNKNLQNRLSVRPDALVF